MKFLMSLLLTISASASAQISYSDTLKEHYSRIVNTPLKFAAGVPLEPPVLVPSPRAYGSASLMRTDGVKVPYESEEAHIAITSQFFPPLYVEVKFFRTVTLTWLTERLILIHRDIGHIAGIEEVLDVIDRRWISQQSLIFRDE